ncbi:hypothetical protein [Aeromicrobium duanguangcaii]|uniref:Uncharacterized protein n=1 Tax=Aeromicrobium duanguangcaii TaxID=2968086 RepID=A0ABY5KL24_9ACTN|nr:hypothetical protein [Aeromicrobium duanguangcaii]MCD9153128.1 hypothetical protein [Aeromicrobium duanguangcaii]UUI69771.1 hypothetical protein NP095_06670 [Aeromicrobium duanguangcaii]
MSWGSEEYSLLRDGYRGDRPVESASKPPLALLVVAAACGLAGLVVGLALRTSALNLLGWFVGGVVALVFFGMFLVKDARRYTEGLVFSSTWTFPLKCVVLVLALSAIVLNAWRVADVVSRW